MKLTDIVIPARIRKNLGDVAALAASIEAVGLLHPVVVDEKGNLIAGARRIAAFKLLGRDNILAHVVKNLIEARLVLQAEGDENTCRLDFAPSEAVAYKRAMEPVVKAEAKERQKEHGKTAPGKKNTCAKTAQVKPKSRDIVAAATGKGRTTVSQAEKVVQAAEADPSLLPVVERMDKTGNVSAAVREVVRHERAKQPKPDLPPATNGCFQVLLADPPWRYDFSTSDSREIENQYDTLEIEDICNLPVPAICEPDAVLFLWATSPKLPEALRVMLAWGFTYKTCMVWVKDKIGMGYYARQRHELLLIGTIGKPPVPLPENRPDSVVEAARGKHSEKPARVYEIIEAMYPNGSRIELFARKARPDWSAWGDQTI
jgi:N6-adenosine-specific RNA methylase IME4